MMTLVEADKMTQPIWKSSLLSNDSKLATCFDVVKSLIPEGGYKLKNPFQVSQFEVLSDDLEKAFLDLIRRYEELTGENLQGRRYG